MVTGMDRRATRTSGRGVLWLLLVVACLTPVLAAVARPAPRDTSTFSSTCPGAAASGCVEARVSTVAGPAVATSAVREIQVNLCDSGQAGCYRQGRSPGEAAGLITRYRPDVVTLNEVCADDVVGPSAVLPTTMADLAREHGGATVFAMFTPAVDRLTGLPYRCVNGDLYGIGVVGRGPAPVGPPAHLVYPDQLGTSDEERAAVCADVGGRYDLCTTHLESDDGTVAARQCHDLMDRYVPDFRASTGNRPTLVGGDLNLSVPCAPAGWVHAGDGGVQHVLADGFRLASVHTVAMRFTDHPALIVDLIAPA
jgi:hypothetical protein